MSTTPKSQPRVATVVKVTPPPAPRRGDEQKASDIAASNVARDAAKSRQLDGATHAQKSEPGAGNSRTGVDGKPIQ